MAEVLSGIGSLFSSNSQPKGTQGVGPITSGAQYAQMLQQPQKQGPIGIGPVANGSQYAQMLQPKPGIGQQVQNFFNQYGEQSKALNATRPQQTPLQMQPMQSQVSMPQIQQQDLVSLLSLLGGNR